MNLVGDEESGVVDKMPRLDGPSTGINVYTFSEKIMEDMVYFQVISLDQSFHIWVGGSPCRFGDMAVAMQTKFTPSTSSTSLIGGEDSPCVAMSQRFAKKTGKQVFVSCNIPFNQLMMPLVEKRIGEEIVNYPDKF